MVNRTRSSEKLSLRGTQSTNPTPYFDSTATIRTGRKVTQDIVGIGDNEPFSVEEWELVSGGRVNKLKGASSSGRWFREYLADYFTSPTGANFPHLSVTGVASDAYAATRAAAKSNPSRPYVDLPVSIAEMGDIPALIRNGGRSVIAQIGSGNLKYQFGIVPIASDIAKMRNFMTAYEIRRKELIRLQGPRGLRRTMTIGTWSRTSVGTATVQSLGVLLHSTITRTTTVEVKVHCRWSLPPDLGGIETHAVSPSMDHLIVDAMTGLGVLKRRPNIGSLSTLWEALPWTWMIDWYGNVGDYLMTQRNEIPTLQPICSVMRHTTSTFSGTGDAAGSPVATFTPFEFTRETKSRKHVAPSITFAGLPILSGKQIGILASLLAARGR
jgi:hypothetical protein